MTELPPSDELTAGQAYAVQTNSIRGGDVLIWTIYNSPSDHPGKFIARPHSVRRNIGLRCHVVADSLEQIRRLLPPGLSLLQRDAEDEPQIAEVWL